MPSPRDRTPTAALAEVAREQLKTIKLDADEVRKMRDYAEDMDVGLRRDLELTDVRLEKLWAM